jgi:hypothetical protein
MRSTPLRCIAIPLGLCALVMIACSGTLPTSPYDTAGKDKAVSKEALEGKEFNQFFPKDQAKGEWDFVFGADKKGYAEAKLKKNSKDAATLSITDTVSNPEAKDKFKNSTKQINGYPSASQLKLETAVLVADRFQVKVLSTVPPNGLTEAEREDWIKKFNLDGLAKLAK